MAAEKGILEELEELMIEHFAEGPAEARMTAFASCFARAATFQMEAGATGSEAMTLTLGYLLHACARHPEWLMAVVKDSQWLRDCCLSEEEYEESNNYFIHLYPLPRGDYA